MEHTDLYYVKAILANNTGVLEEIYRRYLPVMFGMLRRNGGSYEDARDVFQEALVVVCRHASNPGFELTATFQAYLMGIGRFIWLRQLKKNARIEVTSEPDAGYDIDPAMEALIYESDKHRLYREKFAQLGDDCRQLLQRFFDREPLNTIASDMGYTPDYIKKKNKVCKEKLFDFIQKDPRYRELVSYSDSSFNHPDAHG